MNVLVTGHLGFLGRNMTAFLHQQEGWHIDGYDWDPDEFPNVSEYDWVIHLGAIADMSCTDVDAIMRQNLEFSQKLFTACNNAGTHLQYASSSSVYGNTKDFSELAPCNPQTAYAWSKYLFDRWVFQQEQHIMVQGFRYFNAFGKWEHLRGTRSNVIHKWRQEARTQGKISVWEGAENIKRDFTYAGDICQLHLDFMTTVKGNGIWNVGSGLAHSFLDIAEYIAEQENVPVEFVTIPLEEQMRMRTKTCADLTHLKHTIGKRKWLNIYEWLDYAV